MRLQKKKIMKVIIIVIIALFLLFSIVSFVVIKKVFDDMFARVEPGKYSAYLRYEDVKEDYERELLSFPSGKNQLQGYLYSAENTKGIVVISHGMGGMAASYTAETLYFVDHGYQVFAFDNTGCDGSEGKNSIGITQSVIDLDAALTFLEGEERFTELPVFLYGHSWGGYAVTAIHHFDHEIAASVSVAGFNSPMGIVLEWSKDMMGGFAYVEYPYIYLYQMMFYGTKTNLSAVDGINNTDTPILLIHGAQDTTILPDGAATIAHKDEITNPNVQYKICDKELQNDHNNLYMSLDAINYMKELDEEYVPLYEQYEGEIPDEIKDSFYEKIDKFRTSALDEEFMQDVLSFYENAVK